MSRAVIQVFPLFGLVVFVAVATVILVAHRANRMSVEFEVWGPSPVSFDSSESVVVFLDGKGLEDAVYQDFDLSTLEDLLIERIEPTGIGRLDGNEIGPEGSSVHLYGPNAEELFDAILPVLESYPLCRNGRVVIRRFGPVAPREVLLPRAAPQD